jgi:predicted nucleic acid-binding protein
MTTVVLDTSIVIALLSPTDALHDAARSAVQQRERDGARFEISAVCWAELLAGAVRRGKEGVRACDAFLAASIDEMVPVDGDVAACAASLRARHPALRMPDAIMLATGMRPASGVLLTGDERLARHAPDVVEVVRPGEATGPPEPGGVVA